MSEFLVNQVLQRLSVISEQLGKLDATVEAVGDDLAGKTTRSELMTGMDRLQDSMMHLREEVVNVAQAERIGAGSIGAPDEVHARAIKLAAMRRVMPYLSARADEVYLKR